MYNLDETLMFKIQSLMKITVLTTVSDEKLCIAMVQLKDLLIIVAVCWLLLSSEGIVRVSSRWQTH